MSLKQIRLSAQAKDQLVRLKSRTGLAQWNILCRWAFCHSLQHPTPPTPIDVPADSNVEMTWQVFGGEQHELYLALLKERCAQEGLGASEDVLARQFRLHLHRGISYLARMIHDRPQSGAAAFGKPEPAFNVPRRPSCRPVLRQVCLDRLEQPSPAPPSNTFDVW